MTIHRRIILYFIIVSANLQLSAQDFMKYNASSNEVQPLWVTEMYQEKSDPGIVIRDYEAYYQNHPFEKNKHTQYYKRWLKSIGREQNRTPEEDRTYLDIIHEQQTNRNPTANWSCIGPFDWDHSAAGRSYAPGSAHVYTVEQSISNPDILYAGTAESGLWKSTDHGLNWVALQANMLVSTVYAIEIDHTNPNIMFCSLFNSIYKTTNGGTTFNPTGNATFQGLSLNTNDIRMLPSDHNVVFACTDQGLFRTSNGGTTWTNIVSGDFLEVEIHPTNNSIIYAVRKNVDITEFFRSLDGGVSFTKVGTNWPVPPSGGDQRRTEIAVSIHHPNDVYAHCSGNANGGSGLYGVYVSTDQGLTWTFSCCGPQPAGPPSTTNPNLMAWSDDGTDDGGQYYYDMGFAVSPTNADSIFLAGVNLWVSGNGGSSFTCPSKWSHPHKPNYVHADIHDIHYYNHTKELWIACDGGIFYSNDNGANFQRRNVGISGTDFWGFGQGWWYGDVMLGGAYHNGTMLKEENVYLNGWLCTDGGDGTLGFVNPGFDRQVYSWFDIKKLKSDRTISPETRSFDYKPNNSYITGQSNDLLIDPRYYSHWLTGSGTALYKTEDNGYTYSMIHDFGVNVAAMDQCWSDPSVIYVCTFPDWWGVKQIFRSTDSGLSWTNITPSSSMVNGSTWIPYDIAVDHNDPMKIWIARTSMYDSNINGYSVFHSTNGGSTWQNVSNTGLNGHSPTSIFLQKGTNDGIYIGTRKAVFYKDQSLANWVPFISGLPAQTNCTKLEGYYRKQKIRNATNRSIWESDYYGNSLPVAYPSANTSNIGCTRDTVFFVDHSVVSDQGVSWLWTFEGGTPATSTSRNPSVLYNQAGQYDVTLTVTDNFGSSTKTIADMINVENYCDLDTIPGKTLKLTTTTDYAVAPALNISTNTMTISCWVKPNGAQPSWAGIVFSGSGGACGLNVRSNNQLGYHWAGASGTYNWSGGPTLPLNVWSHVALVITPTSATVYLNGVGYTRIASHPSVNFNTDFRFGRDRSSSDRTFVGQLDEVAIYNKSMTINEIRELRHLTRKNENDIISYYQFNEPSTENTAYDKIGQKHAILVGGATRNVSTGPFGGGFSKRIYVNSSGEKDFLNAEVKMYFHPTSTYPNGDLVVTKIHLLPDVVPSVVYPPNCYWVVNNYGTNQTFTTLDSIRFYESGNITGGCVNLDYKYYKRLSNDDGNTWGSTVDNADFVYPYSPSFLTFSSGNNITSFSQFFIARNNKENNGTEICNGEDDDCDGLIDENYSLLVTNNADNGANTLRAILNCAQDGDTIRFDVNIDTITLLSPIVLNKTLVIQDDIPTNVVIKSNLNGPGFVNALGSIQIGINGEITCKNIHFFQVNNSVAKPLLLNNGWLTLEDCRLSGNPAAVLKHESGSTYHSKGLVQIGQ